MAVALLKKHGEGWDQFDEQHLDYCLGCAKRVIEQVRSRSDEQLIRDAAEASERIAGGPPTSDQSVLSVALGLASEAIFRETGMRLYDVQLRGALVVATGHIAEMQTGEGKTLVTGAASMLQCLTRKGVHVATTNAYLAERDYEQVAPAVRRLGFSIACLNDDDGAAATQQKYRCDITYGTGYQFGFDYLRDQSTLRSRADTKLGDEVLNAISGATETDALRQRGFCMAIIDEADSVLIDEATVPLVLSARLPGKAASDAYVLANEAIQLLEPGVDFPDDPEDPIKLTPNASARMHAWLKGRSVPALLRPWAKYIENALHATHRLKRDQQYVVQDSEVRIVDQNTGRIFEDRSWRDGLHQAVEAAEGVAIRPDDASSARVTRQRFYQLYERVAGLTGTASDGRKELKHFYKLDVVPIATNKPNQRQMLPSRFFATAEARTRAVAESAMQVHATGRPVLIGTPTIEQSLAVSAELDRLGLAYVLLNGIQDHSEADLVGAAGKQGSIMVATNMAGRGTDIKPSKQALQSGGLHVIATEFAMSRRVDRQLAGRAARQGDPGSCQFFASADDGLLEHEPSIAGRIVGSADNSGESTRNFEAEIAALQVRMEQENFQARLKFVQSDAWFDSVRQALN